MPTTTDVMPRPDERPTTVNGGSGRALAKEIPNAELLPLDGVGHEVPPEPC